MTPRPGGDEGRKDSDMTSVEKLIAAIDRYDVLLHKHIAEDISARNDPELEEAAVLLNIAIGEARKAEAELIKKQRQ